MTDQPPVNKKRSIGEVVWWVIAAAFILWGFLALARPAIALGFFVAAVLAAPPVQKVVALRLKGSIWLPRSLALVVWMAASVASTPIPAPSPASVPIAEDQPTTPRRSATLRDRIDRATERVDLYIKDDLYNQPGHREDYETGMLPNELKQLEDWGTLIFEGRRAQYTDDNLAALNQLIARASMYQRREFPRYRAGFAKAAAARVWEQDMEVQATGPRNSILTVTSYAFAANRNIALVEATIREGAEKVRFNRIEFQTYRGGRRTWYDLETPADEDVGVWVGREFMSASSPGADEAIMLTPRTSDR